MGKVKTQKQKKKNENCHIKSMTGFGKGTITSPYGNVTAEIKTLNHKSLSISCHPFNGIFFLEDAVKNVIEKKVYRGKIFVKIENEGKSEKSTKNLQLDENLAKKYLLEIKRFKRKLKINGEIELIDILEFPGVVKYDENKETKQIWPYAVKALEKAANNLIEYRSKEGKCLANDFTSRLSIVSKRLHEIKKQNINVVQKYRKKLNALIKEFAKGLKPDRNRIESEIAVFAKNCDISEEITRLEGHIVTYLDSIKTVQNEVGKKLDFIAQEMQREANTIGSKSSDFSISKAVIDIKSEIEKMREQIKNIE